MEDQNKSLTERGSPCSVVFMTYGSEISTKKFLEEIEKLSKKLANEFPDHFGISLTPRELRFFEVPIPTDDRYDIVIKELQDMINCDYWFGRNPMNKLVDDFFAKRILNFLPFGFYPIDFRKNLWKVKQSHRARGANPLPLFAQLHLEAGNELDKKNMKKLKEFRA